MKRAFDLLLALPTIIIFGPLMLIVAAAIRATSSGPALFKQRRIGQGCEEFTIYKFRSMQVDAPNLGPHFTAAGDPRITKVGKFIRKTSIDELPQLINVIKGDMSIVGPRPDTPKQEADYSAEDWKLRHTVKPGITGLAQATLRSSATPAERLAMDLSYVKQPGTLKDLKVILLTFKQILGKGGY